MHESISSVADFKGKNYPHFSVHLLLLCLLCFQSVYAQNSNLFVHFDKNVYSNNETVYFTGYLIKVGKVPLSSHRVMAVALIRDIDSSLVLEDKFLMNQGVAYGSLTLPDSIVTGDYHFVVYTDKLVDSIPDMLFIQNITIKSSHTPPFKANALLMEHSGNEQKVLISVTAADGRFLARPAKISYRYGDLQKNTVTNASGRSIISLPEQPDLLDHNLYVTLTYAADSTFISMDVPPTKLRATVTFYPEGGNMVYGLASNIGWEVKDQQQRPIALKAFLYKDGQIIDTIESSSYGIGRFMLTPREGANYSVKLVHSAFEDSTYTLPAAHTGGIVMMLEKALASDTLIIIVKSNGAQRATLLVHNLTENFISFPFEMQQGDKLLRLPLNGLPKGLTTLTLTDSFNRPLCERIFFAHYTASETISLSTDQPVYRQREKVKLKLSLNAEETALVSIAVVQNNRLEAKKMSDIESYAYLNSELSNLPIANSRRGYKDGDYLEQVLLVKGWRKYNIDPDQAPPRIDSLQILGQVGRLKKGAGKSFLVGTMGNRDISLITTSTWGSFHFTTEQLVTAAAGKMYVFVNGYQDLAVINDQYSAFNQHFARRVHSDHPVFPSAPVNNTELILKEDEKVHQLADVVVTSKKDNSFNYTSGREMGANACGDYLCINKVLNCPNHPPYSWPIKGQKYTVLGRELSIPYAGCTIPDQSIFSLVKGIHLQKEFYANDYKDPNEPAFFSTIYWNYGLWLGPAKKQSELSFYTGDITGRFRVIVQGITEKDVVYAEQFFEVKGR